MNTKILPTSAVVTAVANLAYTVMLGTFYVAQLLLTALFGAASNSKPMEFIVRAILGLIPVLFFFMQGLGAVLLLLKKELGRKLLIGISLGAVITSLVTITYLGTGLLLSPPSALAGNTLPLLFLGVFGLFQAALFLSVPVLNLVILGKKQIRAALA